MKPLAIAVTLAACIAMATAYAFIHLSAPSTPAGPAEVWCKAVQPGAEYESNSVRYTSVLMGPGTGLATAAQACTAQDGWQTYVPSSAP